MMEKILQWCGTIFAIVGVIFLFLEAIGSIRKRSNTKLSVLALVFLSISLVGYLITEIVLRSKGLPSVFSFVWIIFLWAYLACNLASAVKISKRSRAEKKNKKIADVSDCEQAEEASSTEIPGESAGVLPDTAEAEPKEEIIEDPSDKTE